MIIRKLLEFSPVNVYMKLNKTEKAVTLEDKRMLAIMSSVLFAMLLISQLSSASDNINSFTFDTSYSSLETDISESNHTNVVTPDFLFSISEHAQILPLLRPALETESGYIDEHTPTYFIRAPPSYS